MICCLSFVVRCCGLHYPEHERTLQFIFTHAISLLQHQYNNHSSCTKEVRIVCVAHVNAICSFNGYNSHHQKSSRFWFTPTCHLKCRLPFFYYLCSCCVCVAKARLLFIMIETNKITCSNRAHLIASFFPLPSYFLPCQIDCFIMCSSPRYKKAFHNWNKLSTIP